MADRNSTNEEILVAYDANEEIESRKLDHSQGQERQHAAQLIAFETLRHCMANLTLEDYGNMSAEAWEAFYLTAIQAAAALDADVNNLDREQTDEAANMGGNYFEHSYTYIMTSGYNDNPSSFVFFQKQP